MQFYLKDTFLLSKYVDKFENCAIPPTRIRRYQLLKANSLSVVGRTPRRGEASDPCIYVQQREVGSETLSWKTSVWSKFSGRCHCPGRWHADLGKRGRHNLPYRCSQVEGLKSHLQCVQFIELFFLQGLEHRSNGSCALGQRWTRGLFNAGERGLNLGWWLLIVKCKQRIRIFLIKLSPL